MTENQNIMQSILLHIRKNIILSGLDNLDDMKELVAMACKVSTQISKIEHEEYEFSEDDFEEDDESEEESDDESEEDDE